MKHTTWRFFVVIGALSLLSTVFYALTGMGLWAPTSEADTGRAIVLMLLHAFGIGGGLNALVLGKEQK